MFEEIRRLMEYLLMLVAPMIDGYAGVVFILLGIAFTVVAIALSTRLIARSRVDGATPPLQRPMRRRWRPAAVPVPRTVHSSARPRAPTVISV